MKSSRHLVLATLAAISASAASPSNRKEDKIQPLPSSGVNLQRQSGGWINFSTSGARAIVTFFDPSKKATTPDVSGALAVFRFAAKADVARTTFKVEQNALVSPSNVRPPHNFRVQLILMAGDGEQKTSEVFNFSFP